MSYKETSLKLYKKMLLIRLAEHAIQKYYHEDDMKTPMHMSMGEEAIVVGVCEGMGYNSQVFGSYRSHALYIAKTGEVDNFFLEMYGKKNDIADGKAGSMHLSSIENGYMMSSAIVASQIPVAVGAAYANKVRKNNIPVAVFFGDGAIDEGVFWESLNIACLMKLPIIFVCEDNGLAVHTPSNKRHGYDSISNIVRRFNCIVHDVETTHVEEIYGYTKIAMDYFSNNKGPIFMRLKYHRYLEHVGIKEDYNDGYRDRSEYEKYLTIDPIAIQKRILIDTGVSETELNRIQREIVFQIDSAIENAKKAPHASQDCVTTGVYYERN